MNKWLGTLIIAVLALTMLPHTILADDASLGAVGYGVVPLENDQVALFSERVEVEIQGDQAWVTCVFTFTNSGPASEVLMGFPQAQTTRRGGAPELIDFRALVDGEEVPVTFRPNAQPQGAWDYAGWHTFSVPFAAGQTRTVHNTYHGRLTWDSSGGRAFEYVLHTGATWRGSIGQAEVVVRWQKDREVAPGTLFASPVGYAQGQRELRWHFTGLEPTREDDIHVYFRPVYGPHNLGVDSIFWGRLPPYRSELGLPPKPLIADGDPTTAWRLSLDSGVNWIAWGYGGFPHYATPTLGLGILPGVAGDEEAFRAHGRPKEVLVRLARLKTGEAMPTTIFPSPLLFDLRLRPELEITEQRWVLEDAPHWQFLHLEEPSTVLAFQMVMQSIYPGERCDDVAIAEVLFPVLEEDLTPVPDFLPVTGRDGVFARMSRK